MVNNEDKHKQKLKNIIKEEITLMFEQTLDFAQVACSEHNFKPLRSKILRVGNNCIRNIQKKIDDYFEVKYDSQSEDLIVVQQKR